jgi:hypothetical protein
MLPRRLGLKRESVVMVAFAVWLVYPGLVGARLVRRTAIRAWIPYYNIYQSPLFMDSEVTRWLQEGVARGYALIYSNQSAAAYLALRRPIEPSPLNRDRYGNPLPLETYRGVWPRGEDALLLWYEARKDTAFPLEDLAKLADLEPLRTSEQAGIYIVHIR